MFTLLILVGGVKRNTSSSIVHIRWKAKEDIPRHKHTKKKEKKMLIQTISGPKHSKKVPIYRYEHPPEITILELHINCLIFSETVIFPV